MPSTLYLWDLQTKPNTPPESTILLSQFASSAYTPLLSLPAYIQANKVSLKSILLARISSLAYEKINGTPLLKKLLLAPDMSAWWLSLIYQQTSYCDDPFVYNALRYISLEHWLSTQKPTYDRIEITSNDNLLFKALTKHLDYKSGQIFLRLIPRPSNKSLYGSVKKLTPSVVKSVITLWKLYIVRKRSRRSYSSRQRSSHSNITFFSYLANIADTSFSNNPSFHSAYWGYLPNLLNDLGIKSTWFHLFYKHERISSLGSATNLLRRLNLSEENQFHSLVDSYSTLTNTLKALLHYCRVYVSAVNVKPHLFSPNTRADPLWLLFESAFNESFFGTTCIVNILHFFVFQSICKELPRQKLAIYLQENQAWETCLVYAWKKYQSTPIIGVSHTALRFWDLRYYHAIPTSSFCTTLEPLYPTHVALNGDASYDLYADYALPRQSLVRVEALRYLSPSQPYPESLYKPDTTFFNHKSILVLLDYQKEESIFQLYLLQNAFTVLRPDERPTVIIKTHPCSSLELPKYFTYDHTILDKLPCFDTCNSSLLVYSSATTTAGLEAYLAGLRVIYPVRPDKINLSPLPYDNRVHPVTSPLDLSNTLTSLSQTTVPFNFSLNRTSLKSNFFYLNADLRLWKTLISSIYKQ